MGRCGTQSFVAREHDDHHQIGGERDIDKRLYAENNIGLAGSPDVNDKVIKYTQKLQQEHQQADDQPVRTAPTAIGWNIATSITCSTRLRGDELRGGGGLFAVMAWR